MKDGGCVKMEGGSYWWVVFVVLGVGLIAGVGGFVAGRRKKGVGKEKSSLLERSGVEESE